MPSLPAALGWDVDRGAQRMSTRINVHEVEISAIRAQGPGGQNVNKVSTAIH